MHVHKAIIPLVGKGLWLIGVLIIPCGMVIGGKYKNTHCEIKTWLNWLFYRCRG